jgi:hypothetical protein
MAKKPSGLKFSELSGLEAALLKSKLHSARASILHAGEKGRALEFEAMSYLRSFLPAQYGLGTGFIAHHDSRDGPSLSKQLDIIIYDAVRGAPLITLSTCGVYPIESVIGYVEVKAKITSGNGKNSLAQILRDNAEIRKMRQRKFWQVFGGSPTQEKPLETSGVAIRGYLLAFEASNTMNTAKRLGQHLANAAQDVAGGHLHGVYAPDVGFAYVRTRKLSAPHRIDYVAKHASAVFKTKMLKDLFSFPRHLGRNLPAIEKYFDFVPTIRRLMPETPADLE